MCRILARCPDVEAVSNAARKRAAEPTSAIGTLVGRAVLVLRLHLHLEATRNGVCLVTTSRRIGRPEDAYALDVGSRAAAERGGLERGRGESVVVALSPLTIFL